MFGKKKEVQRRPRTAGGLAQYGLFDVPDKLEDIGGGTDLGHASDEDFEAELASLTADKGGRSPVRKARAKLIPEASLDAMVAESLKDIGDDEELSDNDDDDELLNELKAIAGDESSPPDPMEMEQPPATVPDEENQSKIDELAKILQERLTLYKAAEKKATVENENARARRYGRGVKKIEGMLADVLSGKNVDTADIPPSLPPSATTSEAVEPADTRLPPTPNIETSAKDDSAPEPAPTAKVDQEGLDLLLKRQQEYRAAAVAWKKSGNVDEALAHVKIAKQFDVVIAALNAGETIDLSDMPPRPDLPGPAVPTLPAEKEDAEMQQGASSEVQTLGQGQVAEGGDLGSALKERLEVYRRVKVTAEEEGNSSKVRRYDRICKRFEEAIKLHAQGKAIPIDELPVPPGFPPLSAGAAPSTSPKAQTAEDTPGAGNARESELPEAPAPREPARKAPPIPPSRPNLENKPKMRTSRAEKQTALLQQRQHELKQAALSAKKDGDLDLARDYLRQAKGMQPLIGASKAGLPVDMNSVPLSPLAKTQLSEQGFDAKEEGASFTLVSAEDFGEDVGGTDEQIYHNLETQLVKQVKWCLTTRDHSKAIADVAGYNRWERLALSYTRDLDMLRVRKRDGLPPPQHHYETKTYAIVQSCTDLGDGDLEVSIIRGVDYSREADTYVMFEFPYPSDNPPTNRTSTVKGTNNPEYQAVFPLIGALNRSSRQCRSTFKRHSIKCQVWAKGCSLNPILCCTHPRGFFRSDSLLGVANVKLQPLETQCITHDSFPLMEGRKQVGGKLEVKVRVRNPILTKQIEQITEKWLTIDQ